MINKTMFSPNGWTKEDVVEIFDNNPDSTLGELSRKSGHDISELIKILKNHVGD